MPTRKAPTPEEAKKQFLNYPSRTLSEWADEWGVTLERVRQIKIECGVGSKFDISINVVNKIASKISSGEYTLTDIKLYEEFEIGREAFATWIRKSSEVKRIITEAQEEAKFKKLNPTNKICKKCSQSKNINEYNRSQKYIDGRLPWCNSCLNQKLKKPEKTTKKKCLLCKKEKSTKSFQNNKKYQDGLVPFCKVCKSKSRRAKRAVASKINDTIN